MNFTSMSSQSGRILRRAASTVWNSRPIIFLAASKTSSFFTLPSIPGSLTLTPADIFEFCVYMCLLHKKSLWVKFFFRRELKSLVTLHTHTTAKLSLYLKEGLLFLTILYMYRIQLKNVTHSHMTSLVDQHKTNPEFNEGQLAVSLYRAKTWKKINLCMTIII